MTGKLVTIEGIDGSGKSTLKHSLQSCNEITHSNGVTFTKEPTENEFGQMLREILANDDSDPVTELFLFMADHATHLQETVLPALADGELVICDRYLGSRCAYQGHTLDDVLPNPVEFVYGLHEPWSRFPDCTIFLDVDVETAIERTSSGEKYEVAHRLVDIRDNYLDLIEMNPERFEIVDASQSPEEVQKDVLNIINNL